MQVGWIMRSALDLEYGDDIRTHQVVPCPQCLVQAVWVDVAELEGHVRGCRIIELGLAVGVLEPVPLDDMLPTVPKKPKGWEWPSR